MAKCNTASFCLNLKLNITQKDERALEKRFFYAGRIKNSIISHAQHCLNKLKHNKRYCELLKLYKKYKAENNEEALKSVKKELKEIQKSVGLTENLLQKYAKTQYKKYSKYINAVLVQVIASEVMTAVKSVLYKNGEHLHFKKTNDITTISGKTNKQSIRFKNGYFLWDSFKFGVQIRKNDKYARECLKHRIKFCRLYRQMVGSRWHYYLQIVFEGVPPVKKDKDGNPLHQLGEGEVGIDNGVSMFAVVTDEEIFFELLGIDDADLNEKIKDVQQAIDRSMRVNNPDNYNADGTVKKGRKKWVYSRRCRILRRRLKGLYRKGRARRKIKAEMTANKIMPKGGNFTTEPVVYKGLQRRAKKTTINPNTGRPNSKKRFGSVIGRCTPAMVLECLNRKLKYNGKELQRVNLQTYRASQYNHIDNTYEKKELKRRWIKVDDYWVQRDLYSAFLLRCHGVKLDEIDRDKCLQYFPQFLELHNAYIEKMRNSDINFPSCCGIRKVKKAA